MKIEVTPNELRMIVHALGVAARQYSKIATEVTETSRTIVRHEGAIAIQDDLHSIAYSLVDLELKLGKEIERCAQQHR